MENRKIYTDTLNGIKASDLIIDNSDLEEKIKPQYVFLYSSGGFMCKTDYYVPTKVMIKSIIEDGIIALKKLEDIKKEIIPRTKKHIRNLEKVIYLSKEVEKVFFDVSFSIDERLEFMKTIYIIDGLSDERKIAISSYGKQLEHANNQLKLFNKNYKSQKKSIRVKCRNSISILLRDNGIKSHKVDAENLMNWNGIETPINL